MLFGVTLGIVNLREPFAQIDATAKMRCPALSDGDIGLTETGERHKQDGKEKYFAHNTFFEFVIPNRFSGEEPVLRLSRGRGVMTQFNS
jgi:hypothetical protein